ncbi:cysteine hydrolase family protein [Thalassospira marina]|uniref:Cysteine hydrolase n=1 Tax=Thalassospira marina TaxID=2048283 RepID=A0ABM6QB91_9PROT|nr:cysteine hydrolase family protein [Thalassospira marina]AUG53781.1 cysteine hydrolase [Thalassospira marina]
MNQNQIDVAPADNSLPALILIDWQKGFRDLAYWGQRNNQDAEGNAQSLLSFWREKGGRVIHVHHDSQNPVSPLFPGKDSHAFEEFAQPLAGETSYGKNVNSAFIGTTLERDLRADGIDKLVICGISTDHCVNTSTRMAGNLGFDVILAGDACFCFDRTHPDGRVMAAQTIHDVHLASLSGEFARVLTTANILSAFA